MTFSIKAILRTSVPILLAGAACAAAETANPLVDAVRAANDRFHNVETAVKEGYAPIPAPAGSTVARWASTTSIPR